MTQNTAPTLLKRIYGSGIHLYTSGVLHEGWWIVPVDWVAVLTPFPVSIRVGQATPIGSTIPVLKKLSLPERNL